MSEIKVNKVTPRSGTTVTLGDGAGETVTVDAATVTLGRCGGTVSIACGATTAGMGRTGTVNWCTTVKTTAFAAANGSGYFVNTTSGGITVTLPGSPTAGDIIALKDYADTWDSNTVTLCRNSEPINGVCANAGLATEGQSVTLIYTDGTKGWQDIHDSTSGITGNDMICASGGDSVVTCGDYKTHIFTGDGTFTVAGAAVCGANNVVDYLVVAGGGGAGGEMGGGGGGGGFRYFSALSPAGSPLVAPAGLTVSAQAYPIQVGAGGAVNPVASGSGCQGEPSIFGTITSAGGGEGAGISIPLGAGGGDGGSGGGGGGGTSPTWVAGSGNEPPVSPDQGFPGGTGAGGGSSETGGGGGAASEAGANSSPASYGGDGGDGSYIVDGLVGPTAPLYGTPGPAGCTRYFTGGGGGGGANSVPTAGDGGVGGGGDGAVPSRTALTAGTVNTGGGGGGNKGGSCIGKIGGSGIVMIRYKYQ